MLNRKIQRVVINGGLGNQMFQFAFYLSLKKRGHKCILDNNMFSYVKMHSGYELEKVFGIQETMCTNSLFHRLQLKLMYKYKPTRLVFKEKPYEYCSDAYESICWYYIGVWIHPSYFMGIEAELRIAFRFISVNDKNINFSNELKEFESVSLHIRRRDYLYNPNYNVCKEEYYKKAINKILESLDNPIFVVFSDDPDWCDLYLKQFNVDYKIVNWNKGSDSYQDMFLMSQCKHNVIANSTFSWWGAWLNNNSGKIVIAPKKWTTTIPMDKPQEGWHMLEV